MIGLVSEDDPADLAVAGGEEDHRRLEMLPGVLLRCDGGFRCWSSSDELYDTETTNNVNLSGILIASPIHDVKYINTVLDVKYISRSCLNLTVETEFNC